jgi:glycosyltransferase involved in cell wall biosynthesis
MVAPPLAERGIATRIVTLADAARADDGVRRLPRRLPRAIRVPRTIAALTAEARRADVVLAAGLWAEAAIAARLAHRPLVVRIPGDPAWERAVAAGRPESLADFQCARLPPAWAAFRAARAAWTRAADHVAVPCAFLADLVQGWGLPAARIAVIANATLPAPAASAPDHDLVWLGRMVAQKRLPALVDAAARVGARLLLAGDGPARPPPAPHLTFTGPADAQVLARGKIFVQASTYEGLPHAVLEAKARALPVVATDAGGTRECLRHGVDGLLVPVGDDQALAAAIASLLADPARAAAMGKAGRADAQARFAPARMADAWAALLMAAKGVAA